MPIKSYSGPKVQIQPEELQPYDNTRWSAEEKHDGHFCEVSTDNEGTIVSLMGRSGKEFTNENVKGLLGLKLGIMNSIFIAELEAGTESAAKKNVEFGHSRLHIFDVVKLLGQDTTNLVNNQRRQLLEIAFNFEHSRIKLVNRVTSNFVTFYETIMKSNGEGIVLKRNDAKYIHGKTDNMVRCKRYRYVDYVVLEVGKSKGGSDNFQVGLYVNGSLKRVATIKNLPKTINDPQTYVGKVIECKGAELHDSGALRHGHFERLREDKNPEECTLENVVNS